MQGSAFAARSQPKLFDFSVTPNMQTLNLYYLARMKTPLLPPSAILLEDKWERTVPLSITMSGAGGPIDEPRHNSNPLNNDEFTPKAEMLDFGR